MTGYAFVRSLAVIAALLAAAEVPAGAGTLEVVALEPAPRSLGVSVATPIVAHFDRPVDRATVTPTSFSAFGRWSGPVSGPYAFLDGDRAVALVPAAPLSAGESVMVVLSSALAGADGSPFRSTGLSFQFWTRARPASLGFAEIARMTTRTTPAQATQAYGGIATDLDNDGYLDLTIVNEITADLRVFLNRDDGTGQFFPFLQPPFPVGNRASPSEPADFDGDGNADIAVANIDDGTVSVLRGQGNGKFFPQQLIAVGPAPRGIAVLDADGDGDVDVASTVSGLAANNVALLLNDGSGVFAAPVYFSAAVAGPWALAAADMNEDGILDLVAGARIAQRIVVLLGNGDGTFTALADRPAGGGVWMLVLGDVNGDGHEDVSTINANDGSILLGDGAGGLGAPQLYAADPFGLATDLGDLDGDGDLDWMTASFNGDWRLNLNDGTGHFTYSRSFAPTAAASCSLMLDIDNDADLDLALIDEIADEVIVLRQDGANPPATPPGVPGGAAGTMPLRVGKIDAEGRALTLVWDDATCPEAADHRIVFGNAPQLPAEPGGGFALAGARCGVGDRSPFSWLTAPAPGPGGWSWFLLVADDGAGGEGPWGPGWGGFERDGPGPGGSSGLCGADHKDLTSTCGR